MEVFLQLFIKECKLLAEKGIAWLQNVAEVVSKVFVICCSVASAARPLLQNMMKFNGYYGCGCCYHPGVSVNGKIRYLMTEEVMKERKAQDSSAHVRGS